MAAIYETFAARGASTLPSVLKAIVRAGFVSEGDCAFLRELYRRKGNASRDDFPDATGYECYVNHMHIEDYASAEPMGLALAYVDYLIESWVDQGFGGALRIIITLDAESCTVRFHRRRLGQEWLADDLNSYASEAVLVVDTDVGEIRVPETDRG